MMSLSSGGSIVGVKIDCDLLLDELERLELERGYVLGCSYIKTI
jgi:hypothetical protein